MTRALLGALAAAAIVAPAAAQAPDPREAPVVSIQRGGEGAAAHLVTLGLGKAAIVDLPAEARDVILSEPAVAEAVVRTSRRVFLIGRRLGQTNAFFFDAQGRQLANLEIRVEPDVRPLNELLRSTIVGGRVRAEALNGSIILSGTVRTGGDADRAVQIARRFAASDGQAGDGQIVNLVTIEGKDQVLVKVRVVEMSRSLVKQLGINLNAENMLNQLLPDDTFVKVATSNGFSVAGRALGGLAARGGVAESSLVPQSLTFPGGIASAANPALAGVGGYSEELIFADVPVVVNGQVVMQQQVIGTDVTEGPARVISENQVDASIDAFERVGLLRVLAEPNLTAISGEAAKFLAGGEFPVPVAADDGEVSVEFKPFGVGLAFTPVVLSGGRISLKLATEVSDLTSDGAISTGDTPLRNPDGSTSIIRGVTIPALQVRRAETTVEMPSGGALVMAGLIQEKTRQALEGVPGAKNLPVFGSLFRSRDFMSNETELVIIVTPYLVQATSPDKLRTPADGYQNASDLSGMFQGRLNAMYKTSAGDAGGRTLRGPVGHVME